MKEEGDILEIVIVITEIHVLRVIRVGVNKGGILRILIVVRFGIFGQWIHAHCTDVEFL